MNETKFFEVTVGVEVSIQKNGKPKVVKEVYLVDAVTVTEAETRVIKDFTAGGTTLDFKVVSAKESKILRVIS